MKTLIVYYSFTGNNEALARELQRKLNCDIQRIVELKRRTGFTILLDLLLKRKSKIQKSEVPLKRYDQILLIAPVWDANIATPMKSFIDLEKNNLKEYSFITVCSGRPGQAEKLTRQLARLAGKKPITVAQLMINDLLPPEKKNKIKYTTPYRIKKTDLEAFETGIENFLKAFRKASNYETKSKTRN